MMTRQPLAMLVAAAFACSVAAGAPARADDVACIAASEQSLTLRQQGKLHDALKQAAACAAEGCPAEVKDECARRVASLGAAMPTLILAAKDGAGGDLYDVKVSLDGAPLAGSLDGRPLAIDPGAHTFVFEAARQPPLEKKLVLREGEKDRLETVVIGPVPPPAPAAPPTSLVPGVAPPPPPPAPSSHWSTRRWLGLAAAGAGVVGLGIGAAFAAAAISGQNREKADCPAAGCGSTAESQATNDYDSAKRSANASTIAFVAGGVLVGAGAVLWLTAPASEAMPASASARMGLAPAVFGEARGIRLVGEF
jgi:hypothetical protein